MYANLSTSRQNLAAVFLDYENLFYHLKNTYKDPPKGSDVVHEIVRTLRTKLIEESQLDPIIYRAYADFEELATKSALTDAQSSLYLMGVDCINVLGTGHKNAADMRLCIDLMEVLYTRPTLEHFVIVAGDRDYIPMVQHLRRQARYVTAVSFRETLSGDLLAILGKDNVVDASDLISQETLERITAHRDRYLAENPPLIKGPTVVGKIELPAVGTKSKKTVHGSRPLPAVPAEEVVWGNEQEVVQEKDRIALQAILSFVREKNVHEVWLSPFLRTLTDALPMLADYERKALITDLEQSGAIKVVKREGDPNPFSVIILNWNHPTVVELL